MDKGNFSKPSYRGSVPQSRKAQQEFEVKKGVVVCKSCGAAYFKKHWTHGLEELRLKEGKDEAVSFAVCPACQMVANHQYEGRITVKNLPAGHDKDLEDLVRGFAKRSFDKDVMHRLIDIKKDGTNWVITTTENEMASMLARHIKESLRAVKSRTHFAGDPSDVAEIVIDFS